MEWLDQLRIFVATVENESISKSADNTFVSKSTVLRTIKQLEVKQKKHY